MTAVYVVLVGVLTLSPRPYDDDAGDVLQSILSWLSRMPLTAWITFDLVEFTANIVLFVPLGILAVLWSGRARWWTAPLAGVALSGIIETCQALFLDARVADPRDLAANTLGAVIGMLVVRGILARRGR